MGWKNRHIQFFVLVLMSLLLVPQLAFGSRRLRNTRPGTLHATVTAYTSSPHRITASGAHAFDGVMACPRRYPFGTRFKIEGKVYDCQDRLNSKYGNRFDIWRPTQTAARAFGKRKLAVVLVSKPRSRTG